jgi:uncharacterized cupredoxin-like copper-binding protein
MNGVLRLVVVTALAGTAVPAGAYRFAAGSSSTALGPGTVDVDLDVHYTRFTPDHLTVRRGTLVRFVVRNHDPIRHELIVGPPEVHLRHASGHEAVHPPVPGEVSVEPDATAETVYEFDQIGTVIFACHLPGHDEYGMNGQVEVVD